MRSLAACAAAIAATVVASVASVASAQPRADEPDPARRLCKPVAAQYVSCPTQVRFQIENDNRLFAFGLPFSSDERYTNGWRLSSLSCYQVARPPQVLGLGCAEPDALTRLAYAFGRDDLRRVRVGPVLGQTIYTPVDLEPTGVLRSQRPYAGMAMLGGQMEVVGPDETLSLELAMVWTGPAALGKEFQDIVHDVMMIDKARGWGNQVRSEGSPQGTARWTRTLWSSHDPLYDLPGVRGSLDTHAMTTLGGIHGRLGGGVALRVGLGWPTLGEDPAIQQAFEEPAAVADTPWCEKLGVGLVVRAEGRMVLWNSTLEGPYLNGDSVHTVDAALAVADIEAGISLRWGGFQLSWINVIRSPEIDDPHATDEAHDFRQIQLTAFWD